MSAPKQWDISIDYCKLVGIFLANGKMTNSRASLFFPQSKLWTFQQIVAKVAPDTCFTVESFWFGVSQLRFLPGIFPVDPSDVMYDTTDYTAIQQKRVTPWLASRIEAKSSQNGAPTTAELWNAVLEGFTLGGCANEGDALMEPSTTTSAPTMYRELAEDMLKIAREELGMTGAVRQAGYRKGVVCDGEGVTSPFAGFVYVMVLNKTEAEEEEVLNKTEAEEKEVLNKTEAEKEEVLDKT